MVGDHRRRSGVFQESPEAAVGQRVPGRRAIARPGGYPGPLKALARELDASLGDAAESVIQVVDTAMEARSA